jgi:hypothetical protein
MVVWEPLSDADPPYYSIWGGPEERWIDRSGKLVPFRPQPKGDDPNRLVPFREGDYLGYRRDGRTVIAPRFLQAGEFHEGRASVVLDGPCVPSGGGLCGGPVLLPTSAVPRSVTPVDRVSGRWRPTAPPCQYTFINESGEVVGSSGFEDTADFREGLVAVRINRLWGYVDKNLSVVIEPQFKWAAAFSEGFAAVESAAGYSYIDRTGAVRIRGPFESAGSFHEGLAAVSQNGKAHYRDRDGLLVVPGVYIHAGRFFHGLANVRMLDGTMAYIDRKGRVVYRWKRP